MAEFKEKNLSEWLEDEGFHQDIIKIFEDNFVDSTVFLMLTDSDLTEMIKAVGVRRKLIIRRNEILKCDSSKAIDIPKQDKRVIEVLDSDSETDNSMRISPSPSIGSGSCDPLDFDDKASCNDVKQDLINSVKQEPNGVKQEHNGVKQEPSGVKQESTSTAFGHLTSKVTVFSKKRLEPPLRMPFELPNNYPPVVMAGLQKGQLNGNEMAKFISSIASAIFKEKCYPLQNEYDHISETIVKRYPFLKTASGKGYGYLSNVLSDKMKYLRNAKPRSHKRKQTAIEGDSGDEDKSDVKKPRKEFKQTPKVPVPPILLPGEDRASHTRHLKLLQHEERKVSPDKSVITDLMKRTFPFRRKDILDQPQPLEQLLGTYPSLKRSDQILAELDRIFEKAAVKKMREVWMETIPKIFAVAKIESNCYVKELLEDLRSGSSDECKSVVASMMIIHLLPDARMKADTDKIVKFIPEFADPVSESKTAVYPQPFVLIRGSSSNVKDAYLICEKMLLSKIPASDITLMLFASYYVFNMQYCNGCTNFYSFLEVIFLNVAPPKRARLNHFLNLLTRVA